MSVNISKNQIIMWLAAAVLVLTDVFYIEDAIMGFIAGLLAIIIIVISFLKKNTHKNDYDIPDDVEAPTENKGYSTDAGESIKIVSTSKKIEPVISSEFIPEKMTEKKSSVIPEDFKINYYKIATETLPNESPNEEQFSFFLEKILCVIRESFSAHTAIFFWYDKKKQKLSVEKFISGSKDLTIRKFEVENDILSKIVQNEEPSLLTEIMPNAETDVIRYYSSPQGIRSFAGVPLFFGRNLAGLLAVDSKVADTFGVETVYSLGRFVRIISMAIGLYEERHRETLSERKLKGILSFLNKDSFFVSDEDLYKTMQESIKNLIDWDAFSYIYYNSADGKFRPAIIANHTSQKYIDTNLEVELSGSAVGKCITTGAPMRIDDSSPSNFIRYSKSETVGFDGSFMAVPLVYEKQNFGVLCFENEKKNAYSKADLQFMVSSTKFLAFVVYSYSTQSLLRTMLARDVETMALNKSTFIERVESEIVKSDILKIPGALALIYIDKFSDSDSLFQGNPFPRVLDVISKTISAEMNPLNVFGRMNERTFAVHFFNMQPKDAFIWAEKLRIKIARLPIDAVSKQTTYTVSIGITSTVNKENANEAIQDAELALNKAIEKGGNTVKNVS